MLQLHVCFYSGLWWWKLCTWKPSVAVSAICGNRSDEPRTGRVEHRQQELCSVYSRQVANSPKPDAKLRLEMGGTALSRSGNSSISDRLRPVPEQSGIPFYRQNPERHEDVSAPCRHRVGCTQQSEVTGSSQLRNLQRLPE